MRTLSRKRPRGSIMFTRIYDQLMVDPVNLVAAIIGLIVIAAFAVYIATSPRLFMLGVKNLFRNQLRPSLTGRAIALLARLVPIIWTIIFFIDPTTVER